MRGSGDRLRVLRIKSGLSQHALSSEVQISRPTLSAYENGSKISKRNAQKLAEFFDVEESYFYKSPVEELDDEKTKFYERIIDNKDAIIAEKDKIIKLQDILIDELRRNR